MHPVRKERLVSILLILLGVAGAVGLILYALGKNLNHFYAPAEIVSGEAPVGQVIRAGGLVVQGSLVRDSKSLKVVFDITDNKGTVPVVYEGQLPDLFREGQGIIATGTLSENRLFTATEILAKHDETYMAPEVQDALEKAGHPVDKK